MLDTLPVSEYPHDIQHPPACQQAGGSLYNIEHSNGGLITFPGGIPIRNVAGDVIGAIGVSGDTVENDHILAQADVDGAPA